MLYDLYVPHPGWLQRLDPRTKLLLVGVGALLFVAAGGALSLVALVVGLHGILRSSQVSWSRLGWVFGQLRWLLAIILLLFPWIAAAPGRSLFEVGPLVVTDRDLSLAAATAARVWGMSLLAMALLFTTTQRELVRALVALGMPFRWGLTLAIALRYIPSFARQAEQIQEAQAARGWDATRGDLFKRLRALGPVFVALTIHVFRTVDTLTLALTARGIGRPAPRTDRSPLRMTRRDWIALVIALGLAGAWILLNRNVWKVVGF
ncbi:MAG: energy-coupling factor transporter transmembrane component T family protein [Ardenticatenaceae bacterium]